MWKMVRFTSSTDEKNKAVWVLGSHLTINSVYVGKMQEIRIARVYSARIKSITKNFNRPTASSKTSFCPPSFNNRALVAAIAKKYPVNLTLATSSLLTILGLAKKDDFQEFQDIIQKGERALEEKNFKLAEQLFHEALDVARNQLKNENEITHVYNKLAEVAFESGDYKSARKLFSSVMERLFSVGAEKNDLRILNLSFKLAQTMERQRKYRDAELGYRYCFDGIQAHLTRENPSLYEAQEFLLVLLMGYAYFQYERGFFNKALEYFDRAHEVCIRTRGEEDPRTVLILNNLGTVNRKKGNNESALRYFREAEKLGENFPGSQDVAYVHLNLGYIHLEKDMLVEARRHCKQALKLSKRTGDEDGKKESRECLAEIRKALFFRVYSKIG